MVEAPTLRCNALVLKLAVEVMFALVFPFVCVVLCFFYAQAHLQITPIRSMVTSSCFSEGLAISGDILYQSCGGHGKSFIRALNLNTGDVLLSKVLPTSHFGEGLTVVGDYLFVITWKTQTMLIVKASDLSDAGQKTFASSNGEGWGLTSDGQHLILSDGSARVTFFEIPSPESFNTVDELVKVRHVDAHDPRTMHKVQRINELEFVDGEIFANVWMTDTIVKFSAATGKVTQWYDLSLLSAESERGALVEGTGFHYRDVVPNGVAFNPADGTFVLAGKLWPRYFVAKMPRATRLSILFVVLFVMVVLMAVLCSTLCNAYCCARQAAASDTHPYEAI